ncbi:hypothetical protein NE865_06864 [Phthorimaea operculella]|nr:hypothetical protein NE865_06864 [Phthorimaea operculella]
MKVDISDITCEVCDRVFQNIEDITEHLSEEHCFKYDKRVNIDIEQYKLTNLSCMCEAKFDDFVVLEKHYKETHPKVSFNCHKCTQSFAKKQYLEEHIQEKHDLVKSELKCLICPSCHKVFTSKKGYKLHIAKICVRVEPKTEIITEMPEKRPNLKLLRESLANFLNMCNAMPFKFFMQKFRCFYCSKDFPDCDILRHHTTTEHNHCDPKSRLMKLIKGNSITIKIDITGLCCRVCGQNAITIEDIVSHLVNMHSADYDEALLDVLQPYKLSKENMPCLLCPSTPFRYFSKLLEHMNEFHSRNKIICSFCGQVFGKDPNYRSHLKRHHNPNSLKCNDCHLEFDNLSKLSNHRAKLHGEKSYKCSECFETFGTQYKRQKHLIDAHGSGHQCTFCGKLFTRNSFMKDHIRRTHLKEKNAECSVCKEKFFDNILLRIHMVKHVGERNFHCDVCGKTFLWKKNLRGHMASHK